MASKLPNLVIVGRPNVGKSTLFNRIIGRRVAVIENTPGVTRDRLYAPAEWGGYPFNVVDTGGIIFSDDDPLVEQIRIQADIALTEADVVIFLVDCMDGLSAGDIELANRLRAVRKPILLVVNKADNIKREALATEFYSLGLGELYTVSSLHGAGVAEVLDRVVQLFPSAPSEIEAPEEIKLAIVGRPNVGKSSLLNAFTGEQRAIVSNIPGTTRDAIDTLVEYKGEPIRLIDTAGLRRRGKIQGSIEYYMALRATRAIERADCVLILIDGMEGLTDGDKRTAKLAHELGRACVLVVNKWDLVEPPNGRPQKMSTAKKEFIEIIRAEFPELSYAPICFASAKEASGLEKIFQTIFVALESWNMRISTGQLNRIIQDAVFEKPYTSKGRNFRIYYTTQVATRPPTFALFCNNPDLLHFSYRRYLENRIRAKIPMVGTAIRFVVRSSHDNNLK